jgi:hypothetical protein
MPMKKRSVAARYSSAKVALSSGIGEYNSQGDTTPQLRGYDCHFAHFCNRVWCGVNGNTARIFGPLDNLNRQ